MSIERFPSQTKGISADRFSCFHKTWISDRLPNGSSKNWKHFHMDLKTAFLQRQSYRVNRDVVCQVPPEAGHSPYIAARLKEPAYGMNDVPHAGGTFWTKLFVVMVCFPHGLTDVVCVFTQLSTGESIFSILRPPDLCMYTVSSHILVSVHLRMHSSAHLRPAQVRLRKDTYTHIWTSFHRNISHMVAELRVCSTAPSDPHVFQLRVSIKKNIFLLSHALTGSVLIPPRQSTESEKT